MTTTSQSGGSIESWSIVFIIVFSLMRQLTVIGIERIIIDIFHFVSFDLKTFANFSCKTNHFSSNFYRVLFLFGCLVIRCVSFCCHLFSSLIRPLFVRNCETKDEIQNQIRFQHSNFFSFYQCKRIEIRCE